MDAASEWSIPISALQHHLYCPRQCALIHVERVWSENSQTAQGRLLHQRVDQRSAGQRGCIRTVMSMPISHPGVGIHGIADVVEFAGRGRDAPAAPVEYKRGRPKSHRADEVQLCAQALCLEHMLAQSIPAGALFYGETRRRLDVVFDEPLRSLTLSVIAQVRAMFSSGRTPSARYDPPRCDRCSLLADCRPRMLDRADGVQRWLTERLRA